MSGIKLTKKLVNKQKLTISNNYVTNSHWLIRRNVIINNFMLSAPKEAFGVDFVEVDDARLEQLFPVSDDFKKVSKTEWIVSQDNNFSILFQMKEEPMGIFIDKIYVDGLNISDLWMSKITGPYINAETPDKATILVAPLNPKSVGYVILGHELNIGKI